MGIIILAGTMACLAGAGTIALCHLHRRLARLEVDRNSPRRRDLDNELERRVSAIVEAHSVPHPRPAPERTRGHLSLYRGGAVAVPVLVAAAWLRDGLRSHTIAAAGTVAAASTLALGVLLLPIPGDTAPDAAPAAPAPLVTPSADSDQGDAHQQPAPRATPEDVTVAEPRAAPEEHDRAEEQPAPEDGTGGGDQAAEDGGEPEHGQEPEREHDRAEESDRPPERDEEDDQDGGDQEPDEDEGRWCVPPHHAESVVDLCLPHELLR